MVECRTSDPEVTGLNPSCGQKENLSQVQSELYHHKSLCNRVKYLKLSEVKTRSHHETLLECRTRDPEVLDSNPSVAKKKIAHRSNQNNTTTNPSAPEVKYLKLSEVKTRSHHGAVVECRTRDPEVLGSNPGVAKKKISHRSNQKNTTTNPSAPELNTWNCQRVKPEVTVVQW